MVACCSAATKVGVVVVNTMPMLRAKGYANEILATDRTLYVGGQIGWNAEQIFESHDFIGQMEQAFQNIVAIIEEAGGKVEDITRLTWFVIDKKEYLARQKEVGQVY